MAASEKQVLAKLRTKLKLTKDQLGSFSDWQLVLGGLRERGFYVEIDAGEVAFRVS